MTSGRKEVKATGRESVTKTLCSDVCYSKDRSCEDEQEERAGKVGDWEPRDKQVQQCCRYLTGGLANRQDGNRAINTSRQGEVRSKL